ncbi:hypothetical protein OB914_16850, partial [Halobacteria archaeon HArc-curdl7]|nr:hypothetical protein [Halapricum hydrolyticum]
MSEGHTEPAGSRNIVKTMATRDIYETSFDEDIQTRSSTIQCPGCIRVRLRPYLRIKGLSHP